MSGKIQPSSFYVGWDVGGWNCDKNGKSRDALVILDADLNIVGQPWRGNLRATINDATDSADWINRLFALCNTVPIAQSKITLAIDTPLGFSEPFIRLVTRREPAARIGSSETNPYLFRQTEHYLFEHGLRPLSSVKDMIGSQATKGMHVLGRFAPHVECCGVWSDGTSLTAIEAYPSACKNSLLIHDLLGRYLLAVSDDPPGQLWSDGIDHPDKYDALICALIGSVITSNPDALAHPPQPVPISEGWIWVPKDALREDSIPCVIIE